MKYRNDDIVLVRSDNIFKFKDLIPLNKNYMYLKISNSGHILVSKGKFLKSIFGLKNIEKKTINDINVEFFNDYISNLLDIVKEENSAYQFNFQYKEEITLYSCSIYPCMVYQDCKSFDIVVRRNDEIDISKQKYFTEL